MSMYPPGIESNDPASGVATAAGMAFGGPVGGALAGSLASGLFGRSSAKSQMKFQERMGNTQYQRAAKDLEAAGLNRILALGSPAAAPSGAMATMPDLGQSMSSGAQASTAAKGQRSMQSLQEAQISSARAQIEQTQTQTELMKLMTPAQVSKAHSEAISAEKNATRDAMINDALEKLVPGVDSVLDLVGKGVSSASDAIKTIPKAVQDMIDTHGGSVKQIISGQNPHEASIPGFFDFLTSPSKWHWKQEHDRRMEKYQEEKRKRFSK